MWPLNCTKGCVIDQLTLRLSRQASGLLQQQASDLSTKWLSRTISDLQRSCDSDSGGYVLDRSGTAACCDSAAAAQ